MIDPVSGIRPAADIAGIQTATPAAAPGGDSFATLLRDQLQTVSKMQSEADENVRKLLTGESSNVTEVFTAARKAQVAFSLLMEIRNKMVEAYQDLQNLRV
ncbi:MAG: flagellar hook-basal body complex protein FliE [Phycisphaerae bacterium]